MPATSSSTASRCASRDPVSARTLGISTIHQELSLVPDLSVAENIFLGQAPTRWPGIIDWTRMRQDAARILASIGVAWTAMPRPQPAAGAAADGGSGAGALDRRARSWSWTSRHRP